MSATATGGAEGAERTRAQLPRHAADEDGEARVERGVRVAHALCVGQQPRTHLHLRAVERVRVLGAEGCAPAESRVRTTVLFAEPLLTQQKYLPFSTDTHDSS